ncbi:MAG: hypothetical protein HYY40_10880 [Bacteroidetes bacterium]|nr:hypothetical protein [Bacteroidota bacterium]
MKKLLSIQKDKTTDGSQQSNSWYKDLLSLVFFAAIFVSLINLPGCSWDYPEPINPPPPPPCDTCPCDTCPLPVSLSNHIQPIFTAQCAKTGCHVTGAYAGGLLNLSTGQAYNEIWSTGTHFPYVDTVNTITCPSGNYCLYAKISTGTMKDKLTSTQRDTILLWIQQGARNN